MKIENKKEHRCLHKVAFEKKSICYILSIFIFLSCTGCNRTSDVNNKKDLENNITATVSPTRIVSQDTSIEENKLSNKVESAKVVPDIKAVDYSDCFDGIKGCAVFFNSDSKVYNMYHKELCEKRSSPESTFKILSTLIGLENGIINSLDSTMGYDGNIYSNKKWNKDLSFKEAFKESCVWYFRKVMDRIGKSEVQKWLDKLDYGNCDISEWDGNGTNSLPALNGFWLDSSLEISPKEQVDILAKIFEGKTDFSEKNLKILKEVMLSYKNGNVSVYGKTGTGKNVKTGNMGNGWFVGMIENKDERYYFAVHLTDEKSKDVWGPKAKEIALNIINKYYVKQ